MTISPTEAEVVAAIESLFTSPPSLLKLNQFAQFRIKSIGRSAEGRDHEDLLMEAVALTLERKRIWNRTSVDMVGHLMGVMKSVSSHWAEHVQTRGNNTYLESEVTQISDEGNVITLLGQAACQRPSPAQIVEASRELNGIKMTFCSDKVVSDILSGLEAEMTGAEIREVLGLTTKEFDTAMKRLRRKARAVGVKN